MVDVSGKQVTLRTARAQCLMMLPREVMERLDQGEIHTPKGAVFQTAMVAGIQAAKRTGELIPLCHPLGLDHCQVRIRVAGEQELVVECSASVTARTGVEMEALVGASLAALTIYDMCKAFGHEIQIRETRLVEKTGGKRDFKQTEF